MNANALNRASFSAAMIMLGAMGLLFRDFGLIWGTPTGAVPGLTILAQVAGILAILIGIGLRFPQTRAAAAGTLFGYAALWWLLLKVPPIFTDPGAEVSWLDCGMFAMLVIGAWTLYAQSGGKGPLATTKAMELSRHLFGLALIPTGLSHFVYLSLTTPLIPNWIPFHPFWAYFTGACHLAAGLGLLFGVLPWLAARLEALMLGLFTLLVWVPMLVTAPGTPRNWTEFWVSLVLTVATATVAAQIPRGRPLQR